MDYVTSLDAARWTVLLVSAALVGLNKAGLDGGTLIAVPLMAVFFGARASSGLIMGILLTADLVAVLHYRKAGSFAHLRRLLPWAAAGVLLGALVGKDVPEKTFRTIMTVLIITSAGIMAAKEIRGDSWKLPERWWAAAPLGMLAGFASMVGNAASPVMGLYLLSSGLRKENIVGTSVWFFLLINLFKMPFHIFSWHTFSAGPLLADLAVAPVVVAATFAGVRLVKLIPEKPYRILLITASVAGGIYLLLK